jgi:predicted dehydrogenase
LGVHYIDVFRFLFGEPTTVYAQLQRVSSDIVGEDVQHVILSYGNRNLTCQINHSWASVPVPDQDCAAGQDRLEIAHPIEIDGTRGTVTLKADRTLSVFTDEDSQKWTFPDDTRSSSQTATLQHFVDMVLAGTEFATSGSDYLKTMAIVYACYESSARNSVITIPVS